MAVLSIPDATTLKNAIHQMNVNMKAAAALGADADTVFEEEMAQVFQTMAPLLTGSAPVTIPSTGAPGTPSAGMAAI